MTPTVSEARRAAIAVRSRQLGRGLVHPMVLAFYTASFFCYLAGDSVRAVYFLGIALALAWDQAHRAARSDPAAPADIVAVAEPGQTSFSADSAERRRTAMSRLVVAFGVLGLIYSVIVGWFQRYSIPATISVTALATVAIIVAWKISAGSAAQPEQLSMSGMAAWGLVAVGASAVELTSMFLQPSLTVSSYAHPTLSYLSNSVLGSWSGRSVVLFLWLALGWYLARL
ncbi:MAG: hypothetical protein M0030_18235 [Actinomycetota bacterium]|jgi:hypothetical protein|nr:hypothetical protein [Actinomycetota bacterium]